MRCPDCGGGRRRLRRRNPRRFAETAIEIIMDPEQHWGDKESATKILLVILLEHGNYITKDVLRAFHKAADYDHWAVREQAIRGFRVILEKTGWQHEIWLRAARELGMKLYPEPDLTTPESVSTSEVEELLTAHRRATKNYLRSEAQYKPRHRSSDSIKQHIAECEICQMDPGYFTETGELIDEGIPLPPELQGISIWSGYPGPAVIKQKFQKYDYDCGQACLDMLGYDGYALVPNRALKSSDLWAIDSIVPVLHEEGYDPEALDYTKPHIWGFVTKSQMEEVTRLLAEWKKDNIQKNQDEVKRRYEALTEEEFGALDESDRHALWKEVDESIPKPTIVDAIKAVGEGHWVVRYRDKIYCPKLGTMDAETYTKMAIGFVTQIFLVKGDEDPGAIRFRSLIIGEEEAPEGWFPAPDPEDKGIERFKRLDLRRRRNPDDPIVLDDTRASQVPEYGSTLFSEICYNNLMRCSDCGGNYRKNIPKVVIPLERRWRLDSRERQRVKRTMKRSPAGPFRRRQGERRALLGISEDAHVIYQDTPILGGISSKGSREEIYIDPDSEELQELYQQAYDNSTFDELSILDSVYDTVFSHFIRNKHRNRATIEGAMRRKIVSLDFFLKKRAGLCRHMALTCGALIEMFIEEGLLSGHVSVDRSKHAQELGIHMWCRYVDSNGTIWILDSMHRFNDSLEAAYDMYVEAVKSGRKLLWPYWRPKDVRYLSAFRTGSLPYLR